MQIESVKRYKVTLHHDAGAEVDLPIVTEKVVKFIKNNLGRDQILITETHLLNLSKFSIAVYEVIPRISPN